MSRPNKGPRLDINARGIYEIHWTEHGRSKRYSTRTSDLRAAQKVLGTFLQLDDRDKLKADRTVGMLVSEALGDHKSAWADGDDIPTDYWHEHVVPNVVDKETARHTFNKLHPHFGHLVIADVMPSDVDAYVAARRAGRIGRPSVNHTISRELSVLNAALHHAEKKKRLKKEERPFIALPGVSVPRDRWLSFDEADRLEAAALENIDPRQSAKKLPRVYRFVVLALETAARRTSLLELKREQIDLAGGLIYLNPEGRAQTNKKRPRVPISDRLRPILIRMLSEIGAKGKPKPDDYLLDHDGAIRTAFENAVERAGLGPDVTPHVLRHTKATWMAQAGISMFDLAGVLGDSIETVTKTYAHHNPEFLRDAINAGRPVRKLEEVA